MNNSACLPGLSMLFGLLFLSQTTGIASAQNWPEHEIRLIVNYGPGGSTDIAARAFAEEASKYLNTTIVIENKPGGQGTIGPAAVANARPDGYTIGALGTPPLTIAPHMIDVTYTLDDFAPIGAYARHRFGIAVRPDSEFKTFADLVEAAKSRAIKYSAAAAPNNLVFPQIRKLAGGEYTWVPFQSEPDSVAAVLGGHVDAVVMTTAGMLELIKDGKLRLLASASPVRWTEMPDIPTLADLGYPVSVDSLVGYGAPAGVPEDRLALLHEAFTKAAASPSVQQRLASFYMESISLSGQEYKKLLMEEYEKMGTQLKEAGLAKP
jgi:tripartite-type tricarboxylate transporter receptor subunit TctC